MLLEAAAPLAARRPGFRLVLVGDGVLRERAGGAGRASCALGRGVVFAGARPFEEIAQWLRRSRVFVMTSEMEGLPQAMIEAMSCGVPVVLPDTGDVTTIAKHGENAWIVSPPTAEGFADALGRLLDDAALHRKLSDGCLAMREQFRRDYGLEGAIAEWRKAFRPGYRPADPRSGGPRPRSPRPPASGSSGYSGRQRTSPLSRSETGRSPGAAAGQRHRGLEVDGPRVVDGGGDALARRGASAARRGRARGSCRGARPTSSPRASVGSVTDGAPASARVYAATRSRRSRFHCVQGGELHPQHRRLQRVEAAVGAGHDVVVLVRARAVVRELAHAGDEVARRWRPPSPRRRRRRGSCRGRS